MHVIIGRVADQLARLFKVKVAAHDDEIVQLQFELPGASGSEILVTVRRKSGLPVKWESRLNGHVTMRLRFEDRGLAIATSWRIMESARDALTTPCDI